jgi:peptide/nickel transport system ATP-binding protein
MSKDEPLLSVRDLKVGYEVPGGLVTPVDGVSFDLRPREVVGLVGDAGSGKSTTALALMGLAWPCYGRGRHVLSADRCATTG